MYISRNKEEKKYAGPKSGQFILPSKAESGGEIEVEEKEEEYESLPAPKDMLIEEYSDDVLLHWKAPEFEAFERDRKWYLYVTILLLAVIIYAVFTNSLIMAVTFILIGVVGYIYIHKEPRTLNFLITEDGVIAGREIYDFDGLKSFWIFYEPEGVKVLSLHAKSYLSPYVHIPIHEEDPVKIREILLEYISEEKHEPGLVETLDRLLRL